MAFKPLYDRVVVRRIEKTLITPGGILKSESHTEIPSEGTVISTGPGVVKEGVLQAPQVKAGDRVLFARGAGVDLTLDGEKVVFMLEANILGIL
jgi:chaperonin GroES